MQDRARTALRRTLGFGELDAATNHLLLLLVVVARVVVQKWLT